MNGTNPTEKQLTGRTPWKLLIIAVMFLSVICSVNLWLYYFPPPLICP